MLYPLINSQLIFVSGDESEARFDKFISETSFYAIPFEDTTAREALETRLDITSYPTLIMLGPKPEDDEEDMADGCFQGDKTTSPTALHKPTFYNIVLGAFADNIGSAGLKRKYKTRVWGSLHHEQQATHSAAHDFSALPSQLFV